MGVRLFLLLSIAFFSPYKLNANNSTTMLITSGVGVAVSVAAVNAAAEDGFRAKCAATAVYCALAAAAAVGVVTSLMTARKSAKIKDDITCHQTNTCFSGSDSNPFGSINQDPRFNLNNPDHRMISNAEIAFLPQAERTIREMESKGYTVNTNDGSVTMPDGTKISNLSPSGLAAAGMSAADLQVVEDIIKEAGKEGNNLLARYSEDDGGGMGGGRRSAGGLNNANDPNSSFNSSAGRMLGSENNKPSVAGLSVNVGDDKIGVAGENIFEMIHRGYQRNENTLGGP